MIGLDTNVLARFVAQDDPVQSPAATALVASLTEDEPGYVSLVVSVELAWVLARAYGQPRERVADVLAGLLAAREIVMEEPEVVARALRHVRAGADYPDAVIAESAKRAGCDRTVTFDRRAADVPGVELLT